MKLFSKNLTATDCLKRLSIPNRVLTSFPEFHGGHEVEFLVRYETMEWPLVCTIRRKGRYNKPVLSKGWRKFVLGNGLNVGDQLTFHKEEEESSSLHYRVELKRATKPPRTLSRSLRALDLDVGETISARSCANVEVKKVPVLNCIGQTFTAITSCTRLHQSGSVRCIHRATDETRNTLFKQFKVDVKNEQERELKQFGAIVTGTQEVGTSDTIDHHKGKHNSLKQFDLSNGGGDGLVDNNGQASLRNDSAKEKTAALVPEHFNLGLTVGSKLVLVDIHDQASSSSSFYRTDQRVGFELDTILGQSVHGSVVNLDLTLGHQY